MSPSMENTPSVISSFLPGSSFTLASCSSAWRDVFVAEDQNLRPGQARAINDRGVIQSVGDDVKSSLPNTAETVPALAANPD